MAAGPGFTPPTFALGNRVTSNSLAPLLCLIGCLPFSFLVLGGLVLAAFMALGRPWRADHAARAPLDFRGGSERLLLSCAHAASPHVCRTRRSADL